MNSTTGAAIGSRQGLGSVKHIHTRFIWTQDEVRAGRVTTAKVHTEEIFADLLTKPVSAEVMNYFMQKIVSFQAIGSSGD